MNHKRTSAHGGTGVDTARHLFHETAAGLPLLDYHNHLPIQDLAEDRRYDNLAGCWIRTDPYKHRALRLLGVPEEQITGNVSDRQLFDTWATAVPHMAGNPLYTWNNAELKQFFGVDKVLSPETADEIWGTTCERLKDPDFSARGLLQHSGAKWVCTSHLIGEDISGHATLAASSFCVRVVPSARLDDVLGIRHPPDLLAFPENDSWTAFTSWLSGRLDDFGAHGCCVADHALDDFTYDPAGKDAAPDLFNKLARGEALSEPSHGLLRSGMLYWLAAEYQRRNWAMLLHFGAQRHTSTRLRNLAGPAGGYAGIGPPTNVHDVVRLLDHLECEGMLPRTALFTLHPAQLPPFAVLTGSFTREGVKGWLQCGPAWWYNDHENGIRAHLETIADYGVLSTFIGMTTDSRSLLSMARHTFFRRILCDWIGEQVERGRFPSDNKILSTLVRNICHDNAHAWFNLEHPQGDGS